MTPKPAISAPSRKATPTNHRPSPYIFSSNFSKFRILCLHPPAPRGIMPPHSMRGISSVGRAVASHATGQGFESPMLHKKGTHSGCLFYGALPGLLTPLPVAVSMPWFPCRIAGKVADGCKATWTNAQRLPRRGEPPRRSRWGGGESTARRIKRPLRYTHRSTQSEPFYEHRGFEPLPVASDG